MAKIKQAFTPSQVALPTCGGCVSCGDLDDRHLYILGYDSKYYCKVCFFKMATRWPKLVPYKEPYKEFKPIPQEIIDRAWRLAPGRHRDNKKKGFVDYNVPEGKRAPADQEDAFGLMAELLFARSMRIDLTDEQLITYKGHKNPDHLPGVEVRGRSFRTNWTERDFPVWDKDAGKGKHTFIAYAFDRDAMEYAIRWLPFSEAWDARRLVKMGVTGRDMPGVSFYRMNTDLAALRERLLITGEGYGQDRVQEVQGDDRVQAGSERGLPADSEGREAELDRGLHG